MDKFQLINELNILKGNDIAFLLGAGCSIESDCMSSSKLVKEFKRRIYCSSKSLPYSEQELIDYAELDKEIESHFGKVENEYSYYFEKCFPSVDARRNFIKQKFLSKNPSYGYLCFAYYLIKNGIRNVFTTNFDRLIKKAVTRIDPNYDIVLRSNGLRPKDDGMLNIYELHGDYNYDEIQNTESELEQLTSEMVSDLEKTNIKCLVALGYSGLDKSVMGALNNYLDKHKDCRVYWCVLKNCSKTLNDGIVNLIKRNSQSMIIEIDGFDDLFRNYYDCYGKDNEILNKEFRKETRCLMSSAKNKIEKFKTNCYPIKNNPFVWKVESSISNDTEKNLNENNDDFYIVSCANCFYILGDLAKAKSRLNLFQKPKCVELLEESIPIKTKAFIVKKIVLLSLKQNDRKIFKDNVYLGDEQIKIGLKLKVENFNGKLCLVTNLNLFIDEKRKINDKEKYLISYKKGKIYSKENYETRCRLEEQLLNNFIFEFNTSCVEFSKEPIQSSDIEDYTVIDEPKMIVNDRVSKNQIMLINECGPKLPLFSPSQIKIGIILPEESKGEFKPFLRKFKHGTDTKNEKLIVSKYKGFDQTFRVKSDLLILQDWFSSANLALLSVEEARNEIMKRIKRMYEDKLVDIVIIYFDKNMECLKSNENFDFHDWIKLNCFNRYKTQFIENTTLASKDDINKILFSLSTAIYTKTIGMPWKPSESNSNTLYLGMSFGITNNGVNVGCSQLFDSSGQGLKLIVSGVSKKDRKNQYLTEEEAYKLGIKIRTTYYKADKIEQISRIVIHRTSPFLNEEIKGFEKAFEGIDDFVLVYISDCTNFNCTKLNDYLYPDYYPLRRGTLIKCSKNNYYLWCDGTIKENDISNGINYRVSTKGIGRPIQFTVYHGNQSAEDIAKDILFLTKMDFNSAGSLHSKMPVTIKYSQVVCDILKQGNFNEELIDFKYIM